MDEPAVNLRIDLEYFYDAITIIAILILRPTDTRFAEEGASLMLFVSFRVVK